MNRNKIELEIEGLCDAYEEGGAFALVSRYYEENISEDAQEIIYSLLKDYLKREGGTDGKEKSNSTKIRFEVFKRDKFTCQYCGRKAPDVVLEVDHIDPVCNGGDNDILNLITSCFDCNRGKGKRTLSDDSAVTKQRAEIELRAERRNQIEMIKRWRDELREELDEEVEYIAELFEKDGGYALTDCGKSRIRQILHQFDFQIVIEAAEIASFQYIKYGDRKSVAFAFDKLGGICYNLKNGKRW